MDFSLCLNFMYIWYTFLEALALERHNINSYLPNLSRSLSLRGLLQRRLTFARGRLSHSWWRCPSLRKSLFHCPRLTRWGPMSALFLTCPSIRDATLRDKYVESHWPLSLSISRTEKNSSPVAQHRRCICMVVREGTSWFFVRIGLPHVSFLISPSACLFFFFFLPLTFALRSFLPLLLISLFLFLPFCSFPLFSLFLPSSCRSRDKTAQARLSR